MFEQAAIALAKVISVKQVLPALVDAGILTAVAKRVNNLTEVHFRSKKLLSTGHKSVLPLSNLHRTHCKRLCYLLKQMLYNIRQTGPLVELLAGSARQTPQASATADPSQRQLRQDEQSRQPAPSRETVSSIGNPREAQERKSDPSAGHEEESKQDPGWDSDLEQRFHDGFVESVVRCAASLGDTTPDQLLASISSIQPKEGVPAPTEECAYLLKALGQPKEGANSEGDHPMTSEDWAADAKARFARSSAIVLNHAVAGGSSFANRAEKEGDSPLVKYVKRVLRFPFACGAPLTAISMEIIATLVEADPPLCTTLHDIGES